MNTISCVTVGGEIQGKLFQPHGSVTDSSLQLEREDTGKA